MRTFLFASFTAAALFLQPARAQTDGTVYFLAAGPQHAPSMDTAEAEEYESFVVPVSDPERMADIRSRIQRAEYPVVKVRILAGGDGVNRDFYRPEARAWNWSVDGPDCRAGRTAGFFAPCCPEPGELPEDQYGSASMPMAGDCEI